MNDHTNTEDDDDIPVNDEAGFREMVDTTNVNRALAIRKREFLNTVLDIFVRGRGNKTRHDFSYLYNDFTSSELKGDKLKIYKDHLLATIRARTPLIYMTQDPELLEKFKEAITMVKENSKKDDVNVDPLWKGFLTDVLAFLNEFGWDKRKHPHSRFQHLYNKHAKTEAQRHQLRTRYAGAVKKMQARCVPLWIVNEGGKIYEHYVKVADSMLEKEIGQSNRFKLNKKRKQDHKCKEELQIEEPRTLRKRKKVSYTEVNYEAETESNNQGRSDYEMDTVQKDRPQQKNQRSVEKLDFEKYISEIIYHKYNFKTNAAWNLSSTQKLINELKLLEEIIRQKKEELKQLREEMRAMEQEKRKNKNNNRIHENFRKGTEKVENSVDNEPVNIQDDIQADFEDAAGSSTTECTTCWEALREMKRSHEQIISLMMWGLLTQERMLRQQGVKTQDLPFDWDALARIMIPGHTEQVIQAMFNVGRRKEKDRRSEEQQKRESTGGKKNMVEQAIPQDEAVGAIQNEEAAERLREEQEGPKKEQGAAKTVPIEEVQNLVENSSPAPSNTKEQDASSHPKSRRLPPRASHSHSYECRSHSPILNIEDNSSRFRSHARENTSSPVIPNQIHQSNNRENSPQPDGSIHNSRASSLRSENFPDPSNDPAQDREPSEVPVVAVSPVLYQGRGRGRSRGRGHGRGGRGNRGSRAASDDIVPTLPQPGPPTPPADVESDDN